MLMPSLLFHVVPGERFRTLVDAFIRQGLQKGIPQLFNSLRALYKNEEKVRPSFWVTCSSTYVIDPSIV